MNKYLGKISTEMRQEQGYATLIAAAFVAIMIIIAVGFLTFMFSARTSSNAIVNSASAHYIAQAGLEKAIWSLNDDITYTGESGTNYGDGEFDVSVTDIDSVTKKIEATAYIPNKITPRMTRKLIMHAGIDSDVVSFHYGVQVDEGGIEAGNNTIIRGNVYSNGPIVAGPNSVVEGTVFTGGANGLLAGLTVNGDAYSHTLDECQINGDAYYQVKQTCGVTGTSFPGYPDPADQPLPISTAQINQWKQDAEAGGVHNGNLNITTNTSLGPRKIDGNLTFSNNVTLTVTGRIWVTGNIILNNNVTIKLHTSYGNTSEVIIADGRIDANNNAVFVGAGTGSYLMMMSESTSLSTTSPAIDIANNADGIIFYARQGLIYLHNNVRVKEVTGYKLKLENNITLEYETGLSNAIFTTGPGGSWVLQRGTFIAD